MADRPMIDAGDGMGPWGEGGSDGWVDGEGGSHGHHESAEGGMQV